MNLRTTTLLAFVLSVLHPVFAVAGAPIAPGARPSGALDGKIVYAHGGHGYTAYNLGSGGWESQRPLLLGMVEDLGNKDQMDFLVDHLFRAGATIVPLRPVGHQPNEVVLDNLDPGVSFHGNWQEGQGSTYFGPKEGVPYRFAATSATETATAQYRPAIVKPGVYPVYTWVTHGFNRAADQLYRIHHSGGATEVTVNHRRVGNGPVYLGSYYFEAGDGGYVEISNRSSEAGRVVIADMIRFGNGRGDIDRGGGVSGVNREDEAALYWVMWHADRSQGVPVDTYRASEDDRAATVSRGAALRRVHEPRGGRPPYRPGLRQFPLQRGRRQEPRGARPLQRQQLLHVAHAQPAASRRKPWPGRSTTTSSPAPARSNTTGLTGARTSPSTAPISSSANSTTSTSTTSSTRRSSRPASTTTGPTPRCSATRGSATLSADRPARALSASSTPSTTARPPETLPPDPWERSPLGRPTKG